MNSYKKQMRLQSKSSLLNSLKHSAVYGLGFCFGAYLALVQSVVYHFSINFESLIFADLTGEMSLVGALLLTSFLAALGSQRLTTLLKNKKHAVFTVAATSALLVAGIIGESIFSSGTIAYNVSHVFLGASIPLVLAFWGRVLAHLPEFDAVTAIIIGFMVSSIAPLSLSDAPAAGAIVSACCGIASAVGLLSKHSALLCINQGDENEGFEKPLSSKASDTISNIKANKQLASLIDTASGSKRRVLCLVVFMILFGFLKQSVFQFSDTASPGTHFALAKLLGIIAYPLMVSLTGVPTFKRIVLPVFVCVFALTATVVFDYAANFTVAYCIFIGGFTYLIIVATVAEVLGTRVIPSHIPFCWMIALCVSLYICGWIIGMFFDHFQADKPTAIAMFSYGASLIILIFLVWESNLSDSINSGIETEDIENARGPLAKRNAWAEARFYFTNTSEDVIQQTYVYLSNRYALSVREREVFKLLISGMTSKAIADELFISSSTVKTHIRHIYKKMHVKGQVELIKKCEIASLEEEPT